MLCPNCGSKISKHARYCQSCGISLSEIVKEDLPPAENNGFAVASLVLGILGCTFFWMSSAAVIITILGLVFAVKGRKDIPIGSKPRGIATAGLVLNIIGLSLSGMIFLSCTMCLHAYGSLNDLYFNHYLY